jgi:hypothetical protein
MLAASILVQNVHPLHTNYSVNDYTFFTENYNEKPVYPRWKSLVEVKKGKKYNLINTKFEMKNFRLERPLL